MRAHGQRLALLLGTMALSACGPQRASGQAAPLVLERTIPLSGVAGRIDHLAVDVAGKRLFVAELGAGQVEALDLAAGRSLGRITGLPEPQGIAFLPVRDEIVVASGGDGVVRFYRADDLKLVGQIALGHDADNVRVQPSSGAVVVGYGSGALAQIDPASRKVTAKVPLPAHPEGFQLLGDQAVVNLPDAGIIGVVRLSSPRALVRWRSPYKFNFPLAYDPRRGSIAVVYRLPARLVVFEATTGAQHQSLPTCGDADDVFFDQSRERIYVTCGAGRIEVFQGSRGGYAPLGQVATRRGARTGLYVPQLDRLFVAARADGGKDAAILVFRPAPAVSPP